MPRRARSIRSGVLFAATLACLGARCEGRGGGGGDDDGAPGPDGEMTVEPTVTISGTSVIERGECVGFRIETEAFAVTQPRVQFGGYELASTVFEVIDGDTIEVGAPCFFTGLDLPLGPLDVALLEDGVAVVADSAFTVVETTRLEIGAAPASSVGLADPDANVLGVLHDFDVYEWSAPAGGHYLAETVLTSGALPAFLPYSYIARANLGRSWSGHELVLVTADEGDHVAQVADVAAAGGAIGYGYAFEISPLGTPSLLDAAESCEPFGGVSSAGFFTVDLTVAAPDLDPAGDASCADRHLASGVLGIGAERVLRLVVASAETLAIAARGGTTDAVLYLLPDEGVGCAVAAPCLAAADSFGAGDTETLLWTNAGPQRAVFLVVDDFGGNDSTPGVVDVWIRGALAPP